MRHSLKAFGIRIKGTGRTGFDKAVREAVAGCALTSELMDAMLAARAVLWKEYCRLHDLVVKFVGRHELCRRFMAIPGVGPVTALSFVTAIDDPSRFRRSRDVAADWARLEGYLRDCYRSIRTELSRTPSPPTADRRVA